MELVVSLSFAEHSLGITVLNVKQFLPNTETAQYISEVYTFKTSYYNFCEAFYESTPYAALRGRLPASLTPSWFPQSFHVNGEIFP